ncbi:ATP-binding cassette domain-containing protein [Corynebacterium guangdongense]|uniref:Simple sugar transport system ATP-binding protein n=1 Tax=Corynebacterium guangdongense TaxID=1783348 RepID=A0ABU1ZXG3_9CORY|nr:ATP-binding cassette domain-containing protein [Corynebacterium guangdongense]MDR7328902.1 simple sugar transport system ATP-binding protein [Corynebacterium guangdongense]WJZ17477.1 Xylose import ATP-binding protein XylG [Corynebacterium guangdongense]
MIIELRDVAKTYGSFTALRGVSLGVEEARVLCVLGDNGAGKSTLIKILAGLHEPSSGEMLIDARPARLRSPADALKRGIATVFQDLAIVDEMSVWRNFFLGQELTGRFGMLRIDRMREITRAALTEMGIDLADVDMDAGRLSGGQRQVVAIARAIHFGARVVILDEPTAALGVKQSGMVLRFIDAARAKGTAVVFITHNPRHAMLVGDRFLVLANGRVSLAAERGEVTTEELALQMAGGGAELDALEHEFRRS